MPPGFPRGGGCAPWREAPFKRLAQVRRWGLIATRAAGWDLQRPSTSAAAGGCAVQEEIEALSGSQRHQGGETGSALTTQGPAGAAACSGSSSAARSRPREGRVPSLGGVQWAAGAGTADRLGEDRSTGQALSSLDIRRKVAPDFAPLGPPLTTCQIGFGNRAFSGLFTGGRRGEWFRTARKCPQSGCSGGRGHRDCCPRPALARMVESRHSGSTISSGVVVDEQPGDLSSPPRSAAPLAAQQGQEAPAGAARPEACTGVGEATPAKRPRQQGRENAARKGA